MKKNICIICLTLFEILILFPQDLATVQLPHFNKTIQIDDGFMKQVSSMGYLAERYNLEIEVQSDFRREKSALSNAIVDPADKSNHFVGHAVDINIIYDGKRYQSPELGDFSSLPQPIKDFILECKANRMRWGGDFGKKDPVHFDSGLNVYDPTEWERLYKLYQRDRQDEDSDYQAINMSGTWNGVDTDCTYVFNGNNFTITQKVFGLEHKEKGTFSLNEDNTQYTQNTTHYWMDGAWMAKSATVVCDIEFSENRFTISGFYIIPFRETYVKQ